MYASKWYVGHGIQFNPWFDSYQWYEMLIFHIMRVGIPDPGAVLSAIFMTLTALTLWDMAERYWFNGPRESDCTGPLVALLYVTIPMSRLCSFFPLTEHAMVFLFLLGLNGVLRFSKCKRPHSYRWLIVGGLCAGSACGVDVNALIPTLLLVILSGRGWWIIFLSALVAAAPWYGMNMFWFGNPIFPFHENWFGWMNWGIYDGMSRDLNLDEVRESVEISPHGQLFSPLIWICTPLFIVTEINRQPRNNIKGYILIAFVTLMIAYWLLIENIVHARYWMPVLSVLALMGGVGASRLRWTTITVGALVIFYMVMVIIPSTPANVTISRIERAQYLAERKLGYTSIMAVNRYAPDCRAYMLDLEDYRFYCDFEIGGHWSGPESATIFLKADDHYEWLREHGYDFLIVNIEFLEKHKYQFDVELPPDKFILRPPCTVVRIYELRDTNPINKED